MDGVTRKNARINAGKCTDSRNKANMSSVDFEKNLRNLKGTFDVEGMAVSEEGIKNLKRIERCEASYTAVIEELTLKYSQKQ